MHEHCNFKVSDNFSKKDRGWEGKNIFFYQPVQLLQKIVQILNTPRGPPTEFFLIVKENFSDKIVFPLLCYTQNLEKPQFLEIRPHQKVPPTMFSAVRQFVFRP